MKTCYDATALLCESEDQCSSPSLSPSMHLNKRASKGKVFSSAPIHHHSVRPSQVTQIESLPTVEKEKEQSRIILVVSPYACVGQSFVD